MDATPEAVEAKQAGVTELVERGPHQDRRALAGRSRYHCSRREGARRGEDPGDAEVRSHRLAAT